MSSLWTRDNPYLTPMKSLAQALAEPIRPPDRWLELAAVERRIEDLRAIAARLRRDLAHGVTVH